MPALCSLLWLCLKLCWHNWCRPSLCLIVHRFILLENNRYDTMPSAGWQYCSAPATKCITHDVNKHMWPQQQSCSSNDACSSNDVFSSYHASSSNHAYSSNHACSSNHLCSSYQACSSSCTCSKYACSNNNAWVAKIHIRKL